MSQIPQVADAEAKQLQLDRMKRRATGLLVLMAAVFVAAWLLESRMPWLGYVRATAEAGMVGGVADWFAITALFRRPLNLPIPHTAIIPQRKDRIGRSLGNFVQKTSSHPTCWAPSPRGRSSAGARRSGSASRSTRAWSFARPRARCGAPPRWCGTTTCTRLLERSVIEPLKRRPIAPVLADGLALLR